MARATPYRPPPSRGWARVSIPTPAPEFPAQRSAANSCRRLKRPRHSTQIRKEFASGLLPRVRRRSQYRRRVHRRDDRSRPLGFDGLTALLGHLELGPQQRLRRRSAQRHDHPRPQQTDLLFQPRVTRPDLARRWLLVQPPAGELHPHELEVLDGVGDVYPRAIDAGRLQSLVQQAPRRPHERMSLPILLVARLLAHQHDLGPFRSFAEDGLGGMLPEIAAATPRRRLAQSLECGSGRNELGGRHQSWSPNTPARSSRATVAPTTARPSRVRPRLRRTRVYALVVMT